MCIHLIVNSVGSYALSAFFNPLSWFFSERWSVKCTNEQLCASARWRRSLTRPATSTGPIGWWWCARSTAPEKSGGRRRRGVCLKSILYGLIAKLAYRHDRFSCQAAHFNLRLNRINNETNRRTVQDSNVQINKTIFQTRNQVLA